jgi:hypothetical protein
MIAVYCAASSVTSPAVKQSNIVTFARGNSDEISRSLFVCGLLRKKFRSHPLVGKATGFEAENNA